MAHVAPISFDQGPGASGAVSYWQDADVGKCRTEFVSGLGQDIKQSNHQSHLGKPFPKGKGRSNVHHADDDDDDDDDEQYDGQDDWHEAYMDTYYENDDQYYECFPFGGYGDFLDPFLLWPFDFDFEVSPP